MHFLCFSYFCVPSGIEYKRDNTKLLKGFCGYSHVVFQNFSRTANILFQCVRLAFETLQIKLCMKFVW